MNIEILRFQDQNIAEITGEQGEIKGMDAIMDLIGDIAFNHRVDKILADRTLIDESFFDLRSGFLGELTQKFTNYRLKLAITGDFSFIESLAMKAYIAESRLGKTVRFAKSREDGLRWLAQG